MDDSGKRTGRRSRVACKPCNQRKIRCDVTQIGPPCTNCQHETAVCEILPRKKHRPRMSRAAITRTEETQTIANSGDKTTDATTDTDGVLPDDSACSYIGDTRGPRQSVYELCHPGVPQEAHQSPASIEPGKITGTGTNLRPHEIEYIRNEGGFATIPTGVCDELIRCYFHHVHFFQPVVEAPSFLNEYVQNGTNNISPVLFWSMLLAATNYADIEVLQRAGFESRKAMKRAMYKRAKAFYDVDRRTDKLVLIRSVLLMSFWYTDAQDHTGASHWIGIAITLAQGIGIHRCSNSQTRNNHPSSSEHQRLTRRLWWTCLLRDRWVSLAKGRPMRIHDEDCDALFPCPDDVLHELQLVSAEARQRFIPPDLDCLAEMWVRLVRTSFVLGRILRAHYRLKAPKASVEEIDGLASELLECHQSEPTVMYAASDTVRNHEYHLQVFYQFVNSCPVFVSYLTYARASVTVLYRPYILNSPSSFPENSSATWQKVAQNRAREAASVTNQTLEKMIELDLVKSIKPMFITSLIPAMQIHLFDCKSSSLLQANLAKNRLNLCLLFLESLRDTYWSAGVMYRLFDRAQAILTNHNNNGAQGFNTPKRITPPSVINQIGQEENNGPTTEIMTPNLAQYMPNGAADITGGFDTHYSADFNALEQLLSPGFALSDQSQGLFTDFPGNGMDGELPLNLYNM
ncbi:hypothetical protein N7513_009700 [Penicillium frequentans]|nr:hypothetical protein N7513_009700 [Penicillium glabrum]